MVVWAEVNCPKNSSVFFFICGQECDQKNKWLPNHSTYNSSWLQPIITLTNFLMEPFLLKLYFLFLKILNENENKEACTICFEIRISRKRKWNFWWNGSVKKKSVKVMITTIRCLVHNSDKKIEKNVFIFQENNAW